MNFSTLQGLTIPEGVVTEIKDANGRVLWSAVKPVTITVKNYNSIAGIITYNGVQQTATFTANIGDTIEITRIDVAINNPNATPSRTPYQMINERTSYTVVSDATFEWKSRFSGSTSTGMYYLLSITEIPEGHALVNITASGMGIGSGNTGVTIEGTTYKDTNTLVVPVGTVITCSADNDDNESMNFGIITVNGENVAVAGYDFTTVTYNYTVTGNVTILLNYNKGDGKVTITET